MKTGKRTGRRSRGSLDIWRQQDKEGNTTPVVGGRKREGGRVEQRGEVLTHSGARKKGGSPWRRSRGQDEDWQWSDQMRVRELDGRNKNTLHMHHVLRHAVSGRKSAKLFYATAKTTTHPLHTEFDLSSKGLVVSFSRIRNSPVTGVAVNVGVVPHTDRVVQVDPEILWKASVIDRFASKVPAHPRRSLHTESEDSATSGVTKLFGFT